MIEVSVKICLETVAASACSTLDLLYFTETFIFGNLSFMHLISYMHMKVLTAFIETNLTENVLCDHQH